MSKSSIAGIGVVGGGGSQITGVAGSLIEKGKAVYISADDTFMKGDAYSTETESLVIGVTTSETVLGNITTVMTDGSIVTDLLTGATAGEQFYLTTDGDVSTVCPTGAGSYQVQVGIAKNSTDLLVKIHDFTARWS